MPRIALVLLLSVAVVSFPNSASLQISAAPEEALLALRSFLNRDCTIGIDKKRATLELDNLFRFRDAIEPTLTTLLVGNAKDEAVERLLEFRSRDRSIEESWTGYEVFMKTRGKFMRRNKQEKSPAIIDKNSYISRIQDEFLFKNRERAIILLAAFEARGSTNAAETLNKVSRSDATQFAPLIKDARQHFRMTPKE